MKKIIIPTLCILCVTPAIAENLYISPYIGASIGIVLPQYNHTLEKWVRYINVDLPSSYFGFGFETGIKLGDCTKIVNHGLSFTYDYVFDNNAEIDDINIDIAKIGFSAWNIGLDNYVRVAKFEDKQMDLIFGIGVGKATERAHIESDYYNFYYKDRGESDIIVLKFGTNIQVGEQTDWYTTIRGFIPLEENEDIDSIISIQTGLKYYL